jgi:hypothetical protein
MLQNVFSVDEFIQGIKKGTFGITMIAVTEPKMNKRGNPYYGRVVKATYMSNVALGYDYQNVVNNRLERVGLDGNFQAEKPKGKSWFNYPYILVSDSDSDIKYLRCTMRNNTISKSVYILDGKIVTDNILVEEIKSFIPKSSSSSKQLSSGLKDVEQVVVRDFKLDGIVCLTQGERVFNRIGFIGTKVLREYFK